MLLLNRIAVMMGIGRASQKRGLGVLCLLLISSIYDCSELYASSPDFCLARRLQFLFSVITLTFPVVSQRVAHCTVHSAWDQPVK